MSKLPIYFSSANKKHSSLFHHQVIIYKIRTSHEHTHTTTKLGLMEFTNFHVELD